MRTAALQQAGPANQPEGPAPRTAPPSAPVLVFAAAGLVVVAIVLNGWGRWVTSSSFTRTPAGPDPFPGGLLVTLRVIEAASVLASGWLLWRFLVKPIIREHRLSFDGKFLIAGLLCTFWDPVDNLVNFTLIYNAHFLQFGSWTQWIPLFDYGNAEHFVEPILLIPSGYIWIIFGSGVAGNWFVRKLQARYPRATTLRLFLGWFGVGFVFSFVFETFMVRTQLWLYPGIPHDMAMFAGTPNQFPLYEPFLAGLLFVGMAAMRYFRDDRGQSVMEHGLDTLRCSPRLKSALSTLAVIGGVHIWIMIGYFMPYNVFSFRASTFPALPSYLRQTICGDGTEYACPSEHVPIPHGNSLHIRPDDPRLPQSVRDRQGIGH